MNFLPYAFILGLLGGIVIDCVAMVGGAAAVRHHLNSSARKGSGSDSGGNSEKMPHDYQAFLHAIQKNKLADAIMLLEKDPGLLNFQDPVDGQTPLIKAVSANRPKMVHFLLQQPGVKTGLKDMHRRNALELAQQMNYKKIIKLLKGEKVNLNPWWKRKK